MPRSKRLARLTPFRGLFKVWFVSVQETRKICPWCILLLFHPRFCAWNDFPTKFEVLFVLYSRSAIITCFSCNTNRKTINFLCLYFYRYKYSRCTLYRFILLCMGNKAYCPLQLLLCSLSLPLLLCIEQHCM